MEFKLNIKCDNAAFEPDAAPELARVLRMCADKLGHLDLSEGWALRDINGNVVGTAELTK